MTRVTKLCKSKEIVTVNGLFPGPAITAQEDDRVIVKVTNETPYNATIHWLGMLLSLHADLFDGLTVLTWRTVSMAMAGMG